MEPADFAEIRGCRSGLERGIRSELTEHDTACLTVHRCLVAIRPMLLNASLLTGKSLLNQGIVPFDKDCGVKEYLCPCCGSCVSMWLPFNGRPAKCPVCHTLERHRFVCFDFMANAPKQLIQPEGANVAYFGPHQLHTAALRRAFPSMHLLEFDFFAPGYRYSLKTVRADIQDIPLQAQALDGVIVLHVLEHVPELVRAVSEFSRVVKAGGFVQHETPCYGHQQDMSTLEVQDCRASRKNGNPGQLCRQKDHLHGFPCSYLYNVFKHNFTCHHRQLNLSYARRFGFGDAPGSFRCHRKKSL